jgi:hypothetical protein
MRKSAPTTDSRRLGVTAGAILKERHPDWSVDELLLHPRKALEVCRRTNLRLSVQRPHDEVLRALLNARKRGDLKSQ